MFLNYSPFGLLVSASLAELVQGLFRHSSGPLMTLINIKMEKDRDRDENKIQVRFESDEVIRKISMGYSLTVEERYLFKICNFFYNWLYVDSLVTDLLLGFSDGRANNDAWWSHRSHSWTINSASALQT